MIQTERLTLRAPHVSDAPAVTAALQDIEVVKWLTNPPWPYAQADAEAFIASHKAGAVHFIHDAAGLCGCVALRHELGYWLARDRWGQGYMREAARAVVDQRFQTTATDIRSGYIVGNVASRRILEGLGFREDIIKTVLIPARGVEMDVQKMVLTRDAWEAQK